MTGYPTLLEVRTAFYSAITSMPIFKSSSTGYIPNPSKITNFPSVAIDFAETDLARRTSCIFDASTDVDIYIYNKISNKQTAQKDILELIQEVDKILQTDDILNSIITDCYIKKIISDGGITPQREVYRVTVDLTYLTKPKS